jgi:ankyrin repeat protein
MVQSGTVCYDAEINLNYPVKFANTTKSPLLWTTLDSNMGTDKSRIADDDLARFFVLQGAKPDSETLGNAIAKGDFELVKFLLDHGADPNGISDGQSLLTIAKWHNQAIVQLLIQYGTSMESAK